MFEETSSETLENRFYCATVYLSDYLNKAVLRASQTFLWIISRYLRSSNLVLLLYDTISESLALLQKYDCFVQ